MEELLIEIKKQKLELDKSTEIRQQKFKERFLHTQQEQKKIVRATQDRSECWKWKCIGSAINNFTYAPENEITFASYFRRHEDLYNTDCTNWANFKKVRLLLRKLGAVEHTRFVNYILVKKTSDLTFTETVQLLTELFSPKTSLSHNKWKFMNLTRKYDKDYITFASKHCNDFKLSELGANNFKCLILIQGLVSNKDTEIRRRVLNRLKNEPNLTLQQIAEDCRFASARQDLKDVEKSGISHIKKIRNEKENQSPTKSGILKKIKQSILLPKLCFGCGQWHWYKDCP